MTNIYFSTQDLVQTRFAFSALWETVASYRILHKPALAPLHLPWIRETQAALEDLDMRLLDALILHSKGAYPDFLTPPPTTPIPNLRSELEHLVQVDPRIVQQDIDNVISYSDSQDPVIDEWLEQLAPFQKHPQRALEELAETLWTYWQRTLEPHWPRIQALLEADIMYRAKAFALYGPSKVFRDLHVNVGYSDQRMELKEYCHLGDVDLTGRGMLLIPSVFMSRSVMLDPPWQETMQYGARGTFGLWCPEPVPTSDALNKLLGETRAKLLKHLVTPATTAHMAALFRVSPSAISQHLSWLRDAGLVTTQRNGKHVYYKISSAAEQILTAYNELDGVLARAV